MINYLRGNIESINKNYIILNCGFIGLKIYSNIKDINKDVKLFTYLNIRDGCIDIFGFISREEVELFEKIIEVKGVGPKTALNILSHYSFNEFMEIISKKNVNLLSKVKGLSLKSASQIILELDDILILETSSELEEALKSLGYKITEYKDVLNLVDRNLSVDQQVKDFFIKIKKTNT